MHNNMTRRNVLQAIGGITGALAGTRITGPSLYGVANAQAKAPAAVVWIHPQGGWSLMHSCAQTFVDKRFDITANNITDFGNGVVLDNEMAAIVPSNLRKYVACIGIDGQPKDPHFEAEKLLFFQNGKCTPLVLANAMGGSGAIKAAIVGRMGFEKNTLTIGPEGGTSFQPISDLGATIKTISGSGEKAPASNEADRPGIALGLTAAAQMSTFATARHPQSLASITNAFPGAIATAKQPVQSFNVAEFNAAYSLGGKTDIGDNFPAKMAAAELMVRSGTNMVVAQVAAGTYSFDAHTSPDGKECRNAVKQHLAAGLKAFLGRVFADTWNGPDVIVVIMAEFSHVPDGGATDHATVVSPLVISKRCKNGSTGVTDVNGKLLVGNRNTLNFWQYIAALAGVPSSTIGPNLHGLVA
jgi:hypothetical protein